MITKYINGDITETELKHIIHGVNCQNVMGSGVAKALFTKWPIVKESYHSFFVKFGQYRKEPKDYLSYWDSVEVEPGKMVHSLFTQVNYGYDGQRYVNYNAVITAMKFALGNVHDEGPIAMPKIGCGLAGGNWTFMEQLINDAFGDRFEFWVYDNSALKYSGKNDLA